MNVEEYESYFEGLATKYKAIGHRPDRKRFARIDLDETLAGLRNHIDLNDFCLFLIPYEGTLEGRGDENMLDTMIGGFMVVRNCSISDSNDQKQALEVAKAHGLQLLARMIADKREAINGEGFRFLRGIDLSTIKYDKVGPVFDNAYGWHFEFSITQNESLLLKPEEWEEVIP